MGAAVIADDLVEAMRERIAALDTEERRERYRNGDFPRAHAVRDLDVRYRWDLFWHSHSNDLVYAVHDNILDAHIDTALRKIVSPLGVAV